MAVDTEFHDYIMFDVLKDIEDITSKRMFGGWGLYLNNKIFGLIIDGELFFKVGKINRTKFEKMGSRPFTYNRNGKEISLAYWTVPEKIMSNTKSLIEWIKISSEITYGDKSKA